MTLATVQRLESEHLMTTYDRFPVLFRRGRGMHLIDDQGKRYLDFLSGIGVNVLGHTHPAIKKAITSQASAMLHVSNLFYHDHQATLAKMLAEISGLDRVFFTNSGTEAIEGAIKLARSYAKNNSAPNKKRILALENSFHGRTHASLAITGQPKHRTPFEPLLPDVIFVTPNDIADLTQKMDDSVCALVLEPIQGEGGIYPLSTAFMQAARQLTQQHGALLILDEIQTGLGRTGRWFAYQHHTVVPDIVTVAKPLAAGLPLGAIIATESVASAFQPGMHGTTFGGGPLACAVAVAVLTTLQSGNLLNHVQDMGDLLRAELMQLAADFPCIHEVRGQGLMIGMELDSAAHAKAVVQSALAQGLIINRTADSVLRFLPPFIVQKNHIKDAIRILKQSLTSGGFPCSAQ
jgi:acetylornithine aminotransferase/acetylornithine/N-succinyldiaminopimelate aminotransferase